MAVNRDNDKYCLLIRRCGGWGDQLCCSVAVKAARQRYKGYKIVWAIGGDYQAFFSDQNVADDVVSPCPWEPNIQEWIDKAQKTIILDGPEMSYALKHKWNLKKSRIEIWCEAVDFMPKDMLPHWTPKPQERNCTTKWNYDDELEPLKYIVVYWGSADPKKDYPFMPAVIEGLAAKGHKVIVTADCPLPKFEGVKRAMCWPIRYHACLVEQAALAIGPDTLITHLSASVETPYLGIFGPTPPEAYCKGYPLARWLIHDDYTGKECARTHPCHFSRTSRNWWCEHRSGERSWCLEQIKPETVIETAEKMLLDSVFNKHNKRKRRRILAKYDPDLAGAAPHWRKRDELGAGPATGLMIQGFGS